MSMCKWVNLVVDLLLYLRFTQIILELLLVVQYVFVKAIHQKVLACCTKCKWTIACQKCKNAKVLQATPWVLLPCSTCCIGLFCNKSQEAKVASTEVVPGHTCYIDSWS